MYARVSITEVRSGKIDEAVKLYEDSILPAAKEQQGYRGTQMLVDESTGKSMTITFWESEAAMKAGETSGYLQEQYSKAAELIKSPPKTEHYEVKYEVKVNQT